MDLCENRSGGGLAGLPLTREMSSLTSSLKLDTLTDAKSNPDAAEAAARGPSALAALRTSCGAEPVLLMILSKERG
jgi:hypothetical protein